MSLSVSVLMPAHNAAPWISEAVLSIAAQTYDDYELLLVDDGSSDDTLQIARDAWGADPRLRILEQRHNGLVEALNAGLAASRCPLIARMDADDIAAPKRLELQQAVLTSEPEVAIVSSLVTCFADCGIAGGYAAYERWLNGLVDHDSMVREIFVESPLAHPSVMFRRAAILALGNYQERGWPEDYDLWLRAVAAGLRFAKVPQTLLRWRDHPARHSRTHNRYAADAILRCKAHYLARGPLWARPSILLWGAGQVGRRLGRYLEAEGVSTTAFVDIDPKKIGRIIRGAPVIAPDEVPAHPDMFLIAAVGTRGARELIRARLCAMGRREGFDFLCAA